MNLRLKSCRSLVTALALSSLGLAVLSCGPEFQEEQALTTLIFNGVSEASGGADFTSDGVLSHVQTGPAVQDEVTVGIQNMAVSPGFLASSIYDVILESYTVTFTRTDAGSAVPQTFGEVFTTRIPVSQFGTSDSNPVEFALLPAGQKLLPPLSDLRDFGFEQSTGFLQIQTVAHVHMFGRNIIGDRVELEFNIRVVFCNSCSVVAGQRKE
jgi:hypothetical protein